MGAEKFIGTFEIDSQKDFELLAKLIIEKSSGNEYYKTPLTSDEEKGISNDRDH